MIIIHFSFLIAIRRTVTKVELLISIERCFHSHSIATAQIKLISSLLVRVLGAWLSFYIHFLVVF
jgi:hypothetical protein